MGMRFRKSFKLAPGVKVNLGKKSMGVSFGNKYGGISVNSKTGIRGRASIPGTGISFSETASSGSKKKRATAQTRDIEPTSTIFDEQVVRSFNDDAFCSYSLEYSEYAKTLSADDTEMKEVGPQLNLLMDELERRLASMDWNEGKIKALSDLSLSDYAQKYIRYGEVHASISEGMMRPGESCNRLFSLRNVDEFDAKLNEMRRNMSFLSAEMNQRTSRLHNRSNILFSLQFLIFSLIISIAGLVLFFFNYTVPGIAAFGIGLVLLLISYFSQ